MMKNKERCRVRKNSWWVDKEGYDYFLCSLISDFCKKEEMYYWSFAKDLDEFNIEAMEEQLWAIKKGLA